MGYAVNWIVVEDPTVTGRPQYPVGRLDAISLDSGKVAWLRTARGLVSGLVSTAGGLVFAGDANRRFQGHRRRNRARAVEEILAAPVSGHPISFTVAGRQHIAVAPDATRPEKTSLSLHPEIKVAQIAQHAVRVPPARAVAGYFVTASRMMWSAALHPCDGQ